MYFSQIRVDPATTSTSTSAASSSTAPATAADVPAQRRQRRPPRPARLWIDPRDGRHVLVGCDGGFYATYDRMDHWDYLNNVAIGQFYHVALDTRRPCRAYGGRKTTAAGRADPHPRRPGTRQRRLGHGRRRRRLRLPGRSAGPRRGLHRGPGTATWPAQPAHRPVRLPAPARPAGKPPYRFNWTRPSSCRNHNAHIFYAAGNYVFRSITRGSDAR